MEVTDIGIENLKNAIIETAIKDYLDAIVDYRYAPLEATSTDKPTKSLQSFRNFFRGDWFKTLSHSIDGKKLSKRIEREANAFIDKAEGAIAYKRLSAKKEPQYKVFSCPLCGGAVYNRYAVIKVTKKPRQKVWGYKCICSACDFRITKADKITAY